MKEKIIIIAMGCAIILLGIATSYLAMDGQVRLNSPTVTNNNHTHQEQFQGQLNVYGAMISGTKLRWEEKDCLGESYIDILNILHPTSSYFAKIIKSDDNCKVIYPTFFEKQ